ncbi:MAG TPA: DUF2071 domain-containing protein [Chryseosolibacter sp.]|nr:DUF2071 domain-containing protein [Chryseosolibacter sp.]
MNLPVLNGIIDRRMLINYRVDPHAVKNILPKKFEPLVINGYASGGICLLRLRNIGFKYSPSLLRITSENAAHRFLVKWIEGGKERRGVYIPRRDTDSFLNVWLAGKLFAWPHYAAKFKTREGDGNYFLEMQSSDRKTGVMVSAKTGHPFPTHSMFDSVEHASACFRDCCIGYSPSAKTNHFKTIELRTKNWAVKPLAVKDLHSSFFEDPSLFPKGTVQFDHALLMENIAHEWHALAAGTN